MNSSHFFNLYRVIAYRASARADAASAGDHATDTSEHVSPRPARKSTPRLKRGSKISSHPYRPHVLAKDRLELWQPPPSLMLNDPVLNLLPPESIAKWKKVTLASVTSDTRKNYGAGLLRFTQFCDRHCVPEALRMPASEMLLSIFVAEMAAGNVQSGTADSWLSGLAMW